MLTILARRRIFRHVNPMQFQLRWRNPSHHPPLGKTYLTFANAFDLGPTEHHAAFKGFANHKIVARLAVLNLWLVCVFCQFLPAICMVLAHHPGKKMLPSIFKIRIESHHRLLADAGSQSGSNNHYQIFTINSKYKEFFLPQA